MSIVNCPLSIVNYLIVLFGAAVFNSCNGWLTLEPYDGVTEDAYWISKEDVHSTVVGCYSSLLQTDIPRNIILWGEIRADIMTPGLGTTDEYLSIMRGEINPNQSPTKWNSFYTTINQCNKVIERAPGVRQIDKTFSETMMRQYIAEVTTIRSLMYFYLVRAFSDVPLVTKATDSDDQNFYVPKMEGAAILDSLVKHLNLVRNHLPVSYGNNASNKGRVTRYTAMTLLADIYLWQEKYQECNELCTQIIGSGQYSLIPVDRTAVDETDMNGESTGGTVYEPNTVDADALFEQLYVIGNSVESIFEIQFPKTHPSLGDPFFNLFGSATNRPRLMANISVLNQYIFPVYQGDSRDVFDIRGNNFSYSGGMGDAWKYVGLSRSTSTKRIEREYCNLIIYRLADVILMKAEALNQLAINNGNDQVMMEQSYDLVQQIRKRGNAMKYSGSELVVPINGQDLERLILYERARELAFEGKRWFDVLRNAKRNEYANRYYLIELAIYSTTPEKIESLQIKYNSNWFHYWPINTSAIDSNPNLEQNPIYKIKTK